VQDLVVEPRARRWFMLYFAAADFAVLALLAEASGLARVGVAAMLLAVGMIVHELLRIRRLADVPQAPRLPAGARRPRLLVSMVPQA
jgi:hypothetical protein